MQRCFTVLLLTTLISRKKFQVRSNSNRSLCLTHLTPNIFFSCTLQKILHTFLAIKQHNLAKFSQETISLKKSPKQPKHDILHLKALNLYNFTHFCLFLGSLTRAKVQSGLVVLTRTTSAYNLSWQCGNDVPCSSRKGQAYQN